MDNSGDFWYCDNCGTEIWPKFREQSEKQQIKEAFENRYVSQSLQPGTYIPGGGSKSGKKYGGKEKMKKKSVTKLFNSLFKQT
jgi:hypothetical protein